MAVGHSKTRVSLDVTRWGEDGCDQATLDWVQFEMIDRLINHGSTESLNLGEKMVELSGLCQ